MKTNIDEINAYANEDGTFDVELHTCGEGGQCITMKLRHATIDATVSGGIGYKSRMELTIQGDI